MGDLAFLLFNKGAPTVRDSGEYWPLYILRGWLPGRFRVADCHSLEKVGFQPLEKETGLSCRHGR
jgi:hypothetical protein